MKGKNLRIKRSHELRVKIHKAKNIKSKINVQNIIIGVF
jgi:hypothetical protein